MSRTNRLSPLGSPLVLTGLLVLVLAGSWRVREWFRGVEADEVLRPESAEWHDAYNRWIERGPDSWPEILETLQGDSGPGRRMALLAVGSLRDAPREIRDAVRHLMTQGDPADRREALVAWTGVDRDPAHALKELSAACSDENLIVRGTALELLTCIGSESLPMLEEVAADRDHPAQTASLQVMVALQATSPSAIALARSLWLDHEADPEARRYALTLLVKAGQANLAELEAGARSDVPLVQAIALMGLRELGPTGRPLVPALLSLDLPLRLRLPLEQTIDGQILRFPAQAYVSMPLSPEQIDPSQSIPQIAFNDDTNMGFVTGFSLFSVLAAIAQPGDVDPVWLDEKLQRLSAQEQLEDLPALARLGWSHEQCGDLLEKLFRENVNTPLGEVVGRRLRREHPERLPQVFAFLMKTQQTLSADANSPAEAEMLQKVSNSLADLAAGAPGEAAQRSYDGTPGTTAPETDSGNLGSREPVDARPIDLLLEVAEGPDVALARTALQSLAELGSSARAALPRLVKLATTPKVNSETAAPGPPPGGAVTMTARPTESALPVPRPDPLIGDGTPVRQTALEAVVAITRENPQPIPEVSALLRRREELSPLRALAFEIEAAALASSEQRLELAREVYGWGDELLQRRVIEWLGTRIDRDDGITQQFLDWFAQSLHAPQVQVVVPSAEHADPEVRQRLLLLSYLRSQADRPEVMSTARKFRDQLHWLPTAAERKGRFPLSLRELLRARRDQLDRLQQILSGRPSSS